MLLLKHFFALIAFSVLFANSASAAKILGVFVFPYKSHSNVYNSVMHGLLNRGHELTIVGTHPLPADAPKHTFLQISPAYDIWKFIYDYVNITTPFEMHNVDPNKINTKIFNDMSIFTTEYALQHPVVQNIIHNSTEKYDLVIVEQLCQEAFLMLGHQFNVPVVSIASFEFAQYFNEMFGVFGAWSHVPHPKMIFDEPMSFTDRLLNAKVCLEENFWRQYDLLPRQQLLADKYFAHLPEPRPLIRDLNRNISVLMMNGHTPLNTVRPNVPGLVDIGGVHITDVKPLPDDLQTFLDEANDGAMYFTFGSGIRSVDLPKDKLMSFLNTFRKFSNLRVLWKWEDETIQSQLPPNVKVMKWMPQNDILAHPNIRFFITHGGMLGTSEAVYHGVPIIGIPIMFDQHLNIARAQKSGYALALNFGNITENALEWAFTEMLNNPKYTREVKRISRIYNDRPEKPLDRAVYWVEYVIRHNGARHLRSGGLDLNWFTYFMLDVISFVALTALAAIVALWLIARTVFRAIVLLRNNINKKLSIKIKVK